MSISRRDRAQPELLDLEHWLNDFMYEFSTSNNIDESDVELCIPDYEVIVNIDPSQLRQILLNLVENGVRDSRHKPLIRLEYGTIDDSQRPFLDIIDTGKGLPAEIQEQLFEPFFTTESAGTGLGLYIARELCEANQAILSLDSSSESGSCFRILFPHPDKQHNILE
jgi:two-component system sensor histidine kinase PilS (NtrC family)